MRDIPTCPGEFRALAALFRFTLRRRHLWSSETLLPSFSRPLTLALHHSLLPLDPDKVSLNPPSQLMVFLARHFISWVVPANFGAGSCCPYWLLMCSENGTVAATFLVLNEISTSDIHFVPRETERWYQFGAIHLTLILLMLGHNVH